MPIYAPGKRYVRCSRVMDSGKSKRSIVAMLSLTAMVDMFTVLTIFLLQNYNATGAVIHIPEKVILPKASAVKELAPAHVVTVTPDFVMLDNNQIVEYTEVKDQRDWMIRPLYNRVRDALQKDELEYRQSLKQTLKDVVNPEDKQALKEEQLRKITVQADKDIDFLTIKKVMFTVTEAGSREINFAVVQEESRYNPEL